MSRDWADLQVERGRRPLPVLAFRPQPEVQMTAAPTDTFVNYYEILGLPPTVDAEKIEQKIKEEIRTWRRRTGSPDLSKRQEAELRMQHLAAARETLLDLSKRSAYDRTLTTQQAHAPGPTASTGGRDWVALAEEYLAQNDYHSAVYASRQATQTEGNSGVAWNLRGRANAGLGNLNDAMYEARQAAEIEPNNAQYHFDMGSVCEQMERWRDALTAYETASRLDPSDFVYQLSVAGVYVQNDLPEKALPFVEQVHRTNPEEELVNNVLAETLSAMAENVPAHQRDNGFYMITSAEEIEKMAALIERARGLLHLDPEVLTELNRVSDYVEGCKQVKYSLPPFLARGTWQVRTSPIGAPITAVIIGLLMFGASVEAGLFMFMIAGILAFASYKLCWVPVWKRNQRSLAR